MSGKGWRRRRENTALVEANWPFPDRKALTDAPAVYEQPHPEVIVTANQDYLAQVRKAQDLARATTSNTEQDAKDGQL